MARKIKPFDLDETGKKELLDESVDQVLRWKNDGVYTKSELRVILKTLGFNKKKFLTHKGEIHRLLQDAAIYKKHTGFDALAYGQTSLQEYSEGNPIGDPKLNEIRKDVEAITKALKHFPAELPALDKVAFLSFYFSDGQAKAIADFKELLARISTVRLLLDNDPIDLSKFKGQSGTIEHSALNLFVRQLLYVYRTVTGKKGALSTTSTRLDEDTKKHYGYEGNFKKFICACILPLSETHKTENKISHFVSNVLKAERKANSLKNKKK